MSEGRKNRPQSAPVSDTVPWGEGEVQGPPIPAGTPEPKRVKGQLEPSAELVVGARSGRSKHSNLLREPEAQPEGEGGETLRLALWSAPVGSTVWLRVPRATDPGRAGPGVQHHLEPQPKSWPSAPQRPQCFLPGNSLGKALGTGTQRLWVRKAPPSAWSA